MYSCEELRERLCDIGIETYENEEEMLVKSLQRAEQTIMNYCNCENVPEELRFVALDMAAGEYLMMTKCKSGEGDVKSISEGDVSVTFNEKSDVENLVDELFDRGREEMLSYRRIKW